MSNLSTFIGGGSSTRLWVSGESVTQWDYRKSPTDGDVYQRTAATGTGTTDPADDVTNYVAASFRRISALPVPSAAGIDNGFSSIAQFFNGTTKVAINGISAAARTNVLSLTGRGVVSFFGLFKHATGGGRVEIIVDGRTILDQVTTTAAATVGHVFLGSTTQDTSTAPLATAIQDAVPIEFRRTFSVFYTPATSATGANAIIGYSTKATR